MAEEALSQREFDTWKEEHDKKMDLVVGFIATQTSLNLATERRISTVETNQEKCKSQAVNRTTWVSAIVSAIVGGVSGWLLK